MDRRVDVIGVGAGIVGLAMTRALLLKGVRRVLVLEAEGQIAAHQTGHNSGVRVEAGPNAVLALKREGDRKRHVSLRDSAEVLLYPGFRKLTRRHWRYGCAEVARSFRKALFVRDLQRLVPKIAASDPMRGKSGVRAQAVDRGGRLLDDFHIVRGERSLHVLNAPSPAATASLSIGARIADELVSGPALLVQSAS